MKKLLTTIGLLVVFLQLVWTTSAQIQNVNIGDRIKIIAPTFSKKGVVGTVNATSSSVVEIATKKGTVAIPNTSIEQLYLSRGKRGNAAAGALLGGITGGLVGSLTMKAQHESCGEGELCLFDEGDSSAMGALVGALGGVAVGALIGAGIQSDRWREIPVKVTMKSEPYFYNDMTYALTISLRLFIR